MRKLAILVGVALMSVLFASAVLAVEKRCINRPCNGTAGNDTLYERTGDGVDDTIYGRAGRDVIRASAYSNDTDLLHGNRGDDRLNSNDNSDVMDDTLDTVYGGKGFDICIVDARF
jgi:Ca2+-binding RTX toxin-like protein